MNEWMLFIWLIGAMATAGLALKRVPDKAGLVEFLIMGITVTIAWPVCLTYFLKI